MKVNKLLRPILRTYVSGIENVGKLLDLAVVQFNSIGELERFVLDRGLLGSGLISRSGISGFVVLGFFGIGFRVCLFFLRSVSLLIRGRLFGFGLFILGRFLFGKLRRREQRRFGFGIRL